MRTLLIPQFNAFENYKFIGYKEVKIKNKPNTKDYNKITSNLPGMPVGYCDSIYTICETKKPIEIIEFYDIRQKGINKLKGFFIKIKQ